MMSLPGIFGSGPGNFPGQSPYLRPDWVGLRHFGELLGPRTVPRVGLVWSGDPRKHHLEANRIDRRRSMHFSTMALLAEVQGVEFFSIQKGGAATQLGEVVTAQPVRDLTGQLGDFADTAALIAQLDLLVTVDTSMAHLAGGLGVPVWLLSRFDGCWRWLLEGTTTEWYPSMKIYRQQTAGDWQPVVEQLRHDLYQFASSPAWATGHS
ncbi:hypothetical protein GALL_546250 [mine drainage metagenome]|uniref:TPR repeat-containing protein n=1 Tax=mine drainage metagenome TaxID=410659 RepID=A0A1J5NX66_9ZZZZ